MNRKYIAIVTLIMAFSADRITKQLALLNLTKYVPKQITSFLDFTLIGNEGISFGLLQQDGMGRFILALVAVAISLALAWYFYRSTSIFTTINTSLIIGGALSNAYDRVIFGAVIDFIDFHSGPAHYYIFNIADVTIVIGAVLLSAKAILSIWQVRKARKIARLEELEVNKGQP